ncbi:hypothetical protein FA13DRAFT_1819935 [Coprinellus micaceus]|uniref:Uncharacterized protein n=1 Tax=Coprinellus micaceus TaxID=71717 RepID=A0A4Y7SG82_COPMI|nr:hypothetical protein FA13DRAFT_1819935 [Coprinellus micaceus]
MFDRIWDVLHHPESQLETAQFRFWARKMFTINKNYRITLGVAEGQVSPPQEVLLHDNLLVAIQEQLYDLLCYCHGSTGHGDLVSNFIKACPTCIMKKCGNMDVTSSQIPHLMAEADKLSTQSAASAHSRSSARLISSSVTSGSRHRSAVAQEEAGVIRSSRRRIPTIEGRNEPISAGSLLGFPDGGNVYMKMPASSFASGLPNLPNLQDAASLVSNPWSLIGSGHSGSHHPGLTLAPLMALENEPTTHDGAPSMAGLTTSISMQQPQSHHSSPHLGGNQFQYHQPMVREVSLYKGLPNGWQYRHDDFETAHAEFMDAKRQWDSSPNMADVELSGFRESASAYGNHQGARVPDIAGLWGPDQFRGMAKEEDEEELSVSIFPMLLGQTVDPSPLFYQHQHHLTDTLEYPMPPAMMRHMDLSDSCLPSALRDFHQSLGSPSLDVVPNQGAFMPPIDPDLLGMSSDGIMAELNTEAGELGSLEQGQPLVDHSDLYDAAPSQEEESTAAELSTSSTVTSLSSRRAQVLPRLDLSFVHTPDLKDGAGSKSSPTSSLNSDEKEMAKGDDPFGGEGATVKMPAMDAIAGVGGVEEGEGLVSGAGSAISAF